MENARRKTPTAIAFHTSTTDYAMRYAGNDLSIRQQVMVPGVIAGPGKLPAELGNEFMGAAGVPGTPGVDDACTWASLDAIADQLR